MSRDEGITIHEPVFREEVTLTRGERGLYLVKYDDDTRYIVLDEYGDDTGFTWSGDVEGISDFISIHAIFDDVYPHDDEKEENA